MRLSALTRLVIVHEFSEVHLGVRLGPVKRQVSGRGFPHNELLFPHIPLYTGVSAGEAVFLLQPAMDTCGRVPLLPWSPAVLFKPLVDDRDVFPEHRISLRLNIWQVVRAPVLLVCVLLNSLKAMLCDARNFPQTFFFLLIEILDILCLSHFQHLSFTPLKAWNTLKGKCYLRC